MLVVPGSERYVFAQSKPALEEKILNIYTWVEFLPPSILKKFTDQTGIRVSIDFYESNQILEAKLLTGNSNYDVVFPTASPYLARQVQLGIYRRLERAKLANYNNLDPVILKFLENADPGNQHALPFFWGITGIGYNIKQVKSIMPNPPLDSWAILFDPQIVAMFSKCGVYLIDDEIDLYSAALIYLGLNPYSDKPADLQKAFELLLKVRPYIRRFDTYRAISDLANNEACLIYNWSADVAIARQRAREAGRGVEIGFAIPKEGTFLWVDTVAIPVDAPHPGNAHIFLNFLMQPEIIAELTNKILFANANKASRPFVKGEILNDPVIYPPLEKIKHLYMGAMITREHERQLTRGLTRLKTGR
jgi:putrescine transport system substrate-binding protein